MTLKIFMPGANFTVNNTVPKEESPPPVRPAVQVNKETLAMEQINIIEIQARSLGWGRDQLDELAGVMKVFMPCRVGIIRPEVIGILLLDANGEIRGGNSFYNMRTEQPWIKRAETEPRG